MTQPAGLLTALSLAVSYWESATDDALARYLAASRRDEHRTYELWHAAEAKLHLALIRRDKAACDARRGRWLQIVGAE